MSGKKVSTPKADSRQKPFLFFVKKRNKAKPAEAKTTPFRIRNSLIKTFLQYSESPSLRGFAEAICKNNFAILNLVKSFLTLVKFTFDSLSRKIKIPCLVINFNFLFQGGHSNV